HAWMPHPKVLIHFPKQHRRKRRLPVMAMNDLRMLARLEHELHRRAAKKRKPHHVVRLAVVNAAIEKFVRRMWLDEKTFPSMHETKPHRCVNHAAEPRHEQIVISS